MSRILTTSIPAWSTRSGADTLSSILDGLPSEDIANIYMKADLPDSKAAGRYFQILESDVIRSVFSRRTEVGREVVASEVVWPDKEYVAESRRYGFFTRYRWAIFLWIRELLWLMGSWKSRSLDEFIESFKPDVFLFSIESYPYFNRLNKYIIEHYRPRKIIGYLWDDNFTYKQMPGSLSFKISRCFLRPQVRDLVERCDTVLAISPKMKEECDREFGIDSVLLAKPMRESSVQPYRFTGYPIRLLYTGSLVIGRDKTLLTLARLVDQINHDEDLIFLDIYTNTLLPASYIKAVSACRMCSVMGRISQTQVFEEQEKSDVLVFAESLAPTDNVARLSFSTKITDYLGSGRCIMAIGRKDNASIEYFRSENAALVCTDESEVYRVLCELVAKVSKIEAYASLARECGLRNHSKSVVQNTFMKLLES